MNDWKINEWIFMNLRRLTGAFLAGALAIGIAGAGRPTIASAMTVDAVNELRDDVRLLASGDDGVIMTANSRDDQNPTLFDIPGPVSSRQVFNGWRSGKATVFYAVIVYIKETDGTRLAFKDCVMSRAVIKSARAGEIPSVGTISVNYLWTDETPCYDTAVSAKSI